MNSQPINNPSPKQRFLSGPAANVHKHREMVVSDAFEKGADAAMLQYQIALCAQAKDGNSAMAAGFRFQGALEFLQAFRLLAETPKITTLKVDDNLQQQ